MGADAAHPCRPIDDAPWYSSAPCSMHPASQQGAVEGANRWEGNGIGSEFLSSLSALLFKLGRVFPLFQIQFLSRLRCLSENNCTFSPPMRSGRQIGDESCESKGTYSRSVTLSAVAKTDGSSVAGPHRYDCLSTRLFMQLRPRSITSASPKPGPPNDSLRVKESYASYAQRFLHASRRVITATYIITGSRPA
ncbi:hypothetical protein BU23DRAFT_231290 [Bimuria novae-zelandiae CBS 107.79]|uniref:Uncharacterized protein n=1 Tax=Bimuria novae-zelandiae CBS 107.79 TaxID=1447943 RepID=A0A6A5UXZ1_9PLEO|nr:hypothetical protein BU23DRAFT_231290 [Bimuria novae-zelandiae CBS 107.79]